jgi:hypothetical protein
MSDKIKVISLRSNDVALNLTALNGKVIPIAGKGFAYLSEDELAYVMNTSKIFERGILKVVDAEKVSDIIDIPDSPNALAQADIVAMMKLTQPKLVAKLADITDRQVVEEILKVAKDNDKSVKFVDAIQNRLAEIIG